MRRFVSLVLAMAMLVPGLATAADAAVGTWLSPMPGQEIANREVEVAVGYNTQSSTKVTRIELWVDGKFYSQKYPSTPTYRGVCSFWWNTAGYSNGSHDLVVKIYAGDKLLTKVRNEASVDGASYSSFPSTPRVTFANIKNGDVLKGNANIKLKVDSNSSENPLVTLKVDDSLKLLRNTPPYSYSLDTKSYDDGDHKLETFAYDNEGNKGDSAVVKVAFKNGIKKPVVASLAISSHSTSANEDEISSVIPEDSAVSNMSNTATASVAGRISDHSKNGTTVVVSSLPAVSTPKSTIVESTSKIRLDSARRTTHKPEAVEPDSSTEQTRIALAPSISQPIVSNPKNTISEHASDLKYAGRSISKSRVEVTPVEPKGTNSLQPKAVRMAKAPVLESNINHSAKKNSANCPSEIKRTAVKAKLEKAVIPASGNVKLRDFLGKLGGWLFWDSENHTVTAYAKNMVIEMKIGSNMIKVNGCEMEVAHAPFISKGRTIIDAKIYHKALAFVERQKTVQTAKLDR